MDCDQIAETFDARAARYVEDDWHRRYAQQLVAITPLRAGDRVLDAGTGTGFAACEIARRVGPSGQVLGVDISPGMLEQARRVIESSGLHQIELMQSDATDLGALAAASFDAVVCSAGLLYMPVAKALSAWHRLLKPDGVIAFSTMEAGSPSAGRIFRQCAAGFGLDLKDPSEALGTADRCRAVLHDAGFGRVEVVAGEVPFESLDLTLAWEANFRAAGHSAVRTLDDEQQGVLRRQYLAALEEARRADLAASSRADVLFAIGYRVG